MKKIYSLLIFTALFYTVSNAQTKFGDNKTTINGSSLVEMESTNKGLLVPRITLTDRLVWGLATATPVNGMVVYSNATGANGLDTGLVIWQGQWNRLANQNTADFWKTKGNAATNAGTSLVGNTADGNYWGTTDAQNLAVGTKGIKRMIFDTVGNAVGGKNNVVNNAATQNLDDGTYPATSFMWGTNNTDSSFLNTVFGTKNKISGYLHSNIIAGEKDTIGGFWGWGNAVFGVENALTVQNGGANIVSGIQNKRVGTAIASGNAGILSGYQNIDSSYFSSIVSGSNNNVGSGGGSSIVTGLNNTISTPAFVAWDHGIAHSNAIFGDVNTITSTTSSNTASRNIITGAFNRLVNINDAAVFGNSNTDSADFTLIAGHGNTVPVTATGAAVVGQFNTPVSNMLLAVGNGTGAAAQSNAITVTNTTPAAAATANNSTLNVNGSVATAIKTVSASYTLTDADYTVIYIGGATAPTFTLPDPATCKGRMYRLVNADPGPVSSYHAVTLSRPVSLYSGNTATALELNTFVAPANGIADPAIGNTALIQSDGNVWWRVGL